MPDEDAAVLDLGTSALRLETVDQFPAIWPDPYVLGEIAAAHALSDIAAKGGRPEYALALAGLPRASAHLSEDDLHQLLSGMRAALDADGVALVGGHTSVGDGFSAGLAVSGSVDRGTLLAKSGLEAGDLLVLTKPLGTGLLFAAWMRRLARASDVMAAIQGMRQSNLPAAGILDRHGARAMTDVTGFGLAGHLIEMLRASAKRGRLGLAGCPLYPGVGDILATSVRSSALPANLALADDVELAAGLGEPALALLFDPQTSGGLLAGVKRTNAARCLQALAAAGYRAAIVGEVAGPAQAAPCLLVDAGALDVCDFAMAGAEAPAAT